MIGQASAARETELAAMVVNYRETGDAETLHVHAEGNARGIIPSPVPYIAFIFFYSEPDTQASAFSGLGKAVANKIEADALGRPVRLLVLTSQNLTNLARKAALEQRAEEAAERDKWESEDAQMESFGDSGDSPT